MSQLCYLWKAGDEGVAFVHLKGGVTGPSVYKGSTYVHSQGKMLQAKELLNFPNEGRNAITAKFHNSSDYRHPPPRGLPVFKKRLHNAAREVYRRFYEASCFTRRLVMQLKTVSSIGLAFLLVFGVVGVASAQDVAATQGVLIRVDAPAANTWAAIEDTIRIRILCYDGILDGGFRVSVVDSSLDDDAVAANGRGTADVGPKIFYNYPYAGTDTDQITKGDGSTSGIDTFKVKIGIEAAANFESDSNHALKVVLDLDATAVGGELNNLMANKKITSATAGFGATRVGDGVLFGIDGSRPVHGTGDNAIFSSITLDLTKLETVENDTTGSPTDPLLVQEIKINTDDVFRAVLNLTTRNVLTNKAHKIEVGLVPADSIARYVAAEGDGGLGLGAELANARAFKDDALIKLTVSGDRLVIPNPSVSKKAVAGTFGDNQRLELFAYVVDVAGNVGGTDTEPAAANWRLLHGTDGVFATLAAAGDSTAPAGPGVNTNVAIIGDATAPKITVNYPNPDSIAAGSHDPRISAAITQTLGADAYTLLPGEASGVQTARPLKPLKFELSEAPSRITIKHADSTLILEDYVGDNPATLDETETDFALDPTGADKIATVDFLNIDIPEDGTEGTQPSDQPLWFTTTENVVAGVDDGKYEAKGGTVGDIVITVWDSLDNKSALTLEGITLDGNTPGIINLFPTADDAPKDADNEGRPTIDPTTKNPVFNINEELDSLSIRYHEAGGGPPIIQVYGPGNARLETVSSLVSWPVADTLIDRQRYNLEVLAIDLAGNASVAKGGELTFKKTFTNPDADLFKIAATPEEKGVAGVDVSLAMTVIDTTLTRMEKEQDSAAGDVRAVTYHTPSALAVIVSGDQADALEGVTFSGTGVSPAPAFALPADLAALGMVAKAAVLDGGGWNAGQRTVKFKSTKPLTGITVMAAEGSIDPGTGAYTLRISGEAAKAINIEVAEFSKFNVTAIEGEISTDNVAGAFSVHVVPADAFGNPSLKIENTAGSKTETSVAFTFASSNASVSVPSGQQMVTSTDGATFGAVAGNATGSATISVRTVRENYTTGETQSEDSDKNSALTGSVTVNVVSEDGDGPDPGAPAAPANIVVQDYKGADGEGDQGGIVVISFPNSSQHDAVSAYQISREIDSTTGMDDEGNVVELEEPMKKWVAWTSVSFSADAGDEMGDAEGDMQTVIVPAIDNVATNWGVTAVTAAGESDMTTASKRVFTKETIQQTLQLLGMPEAELLTDEELNNVFNAPEDYVKALIGDQKNVIFAPVNPDVSALIGSAAVPANIRTGHAGSFLSSARTVTEEPAGATDDIAPAAVTDASGTGAGGVILRWTASASEGEVGSIPYRGYNIPIMGVKGYKVMRGASADALEAAATVPSGSTQFTDDNLPDGMTTLVYRIDAFDDNNVAMSDLITVENISVRVAFVDANGDPVYLMVLPAQGGDLEVNFEDILAFGAAFGSKKGDANYNPQADVNDDGSVDFADLATAAATFGRVAVPPAGSKVAVVPQRPGVNADTEMTLELASEKVLVGETISLTVSMANARALNGYGLELVYDADNFEFVSAVPAENDLLKSEGGETPLFKNWPEEGRISVVNLITESGTVSGEGALVTFTFKVLREFAENARFEIAQGVVFDADQLQNPVVTLGALDVQSTPTEFALHQNYPNPFNPQTNIPYDLAEGGDVVLRIYNLLGQEVRTLVRERQAPGRYTVQWSGMDDRGVSVSSGIYFYQVSVAGKFQDAKRLMLLK